MQPPVLPAVLLVTVGLWLPIAVCEVTFPTVGDASLTNVQFYNGMVYLAGNSKLYALTGDLSQTLQEVDTCFGNSNCGNVNKILLVNKYTNQILTCGTKRANGTCQIRPLHNLTIISGTSSSVDYRSKAIRLTSSPSRIPLGLITSKGYLYTGITWAPDVGETLSQQDNFYFLSSRNFSTFEYEIEDFNEKNIMFKLTVNLENYIIYFKSVFEDDNFTYFLTNQKMNANDVHYVSKIIRLCQNDKGFRSYTDVPIECRSNAGTYNLAQAASLFEPGLELRRSLNLSAGDKVLAVAFTNDTAPENPSPEYSSVVCLYSLHHVNERIMAAKKNDITCSTSSLSDSDRYLERIKNSETGEKLCHPPEDKVPYNETQMICPIDLNYFYLAGTYNERVSSTTVYSTTEADITRVLGSAVLGTMFTHLYLGTSHGQLIMVNVNSPDGQEYSTLDVDLGHPVLDIHEEDDSYYVMSERKLVRYEMTDCSEYRSCESVMNSRNPHCGWCIYSSRSTVNASCSNHWLSALGDCVTIHLNPKGAAINTGTNVIVHASSNLPENVTGDTYFCRFVNTTIPDVPAEKTSSTTFLCTVPDTVGAQTAAKLQLFIRHQQDDIRLAETDFLFFDCSYYKRCGMCVGDEGSDCEWCTASTRCQPTNQICDQPVMSKQVDTCPRLENTGQHYLPADVITTLQLAAANIDTSLSYVCHIGGQDIQANPSVSSLECPVKVSFEEEDTEMKFSISVTYGTEKVPLENGQPNTVTVYKCEFESNSTRRDCSQCGALNQTRYSCHWCADSRGCGYSKGCEGKICPPPTITKVLPLSTTLNGTTLITIIGTELGSHVDDITNIKIGGITCHKNDTHGFIVSKRIVCRAGPSNNVMVNQAVTVTVDHQSGSSDNIFSYLDPSPTGITPTSGPVAGGTRLTITGEHLGVGSRQVQVKFGSDNCRNARVEPTVPFDVREPFQINCETVHSTEEKSTAVQVEFDGIIKTVPINYNYTKNPTIAGVTPRKAIAIGGTRIIVTGEDMNNAHDAHITITDSRKETKMASCGERTDIQMVCKMPPLTEYLKNQLSSVSSVRRKRATSCDGSECILVPITVRLDGVHQSFADVQYFPDPQFNMLEEGGGVRSHSTDNQYLTITGTNLDLVATPADISITIGVDICAIVTLTATNVTCSAPKQQPLSDIYGKQKAEVNVTVGNLKATVGYLVYQEDTDNAVIIGAVSGGAAALIVIVVLIVVFVKYRRIGKTAQEMQQTLFELEATLKTNQVFREACAEQGDEAAAGAALNRQGLDEETIAFLHDQNLLIERQRLQLGKQLGQGHFGSVFEGFLAFPGQKGGDLVAAKTLHQDSPREIDVMAFTKEALIMKDFDHENVLSLIGICLGMDDMPLVILPYMEHGDLLSYIKDKKKNPTIKDIINFGIDICDGMTYLSERKFVHRDLAARNCMLDADFKVKVADFGLSRDIYEKDYYACESKKTKLPIKWMALECLEKGKYSSKSDVWSYGIVLWELLTRGVNPYPGVDNWDIVRYLKHGRRMPQPLYCPDHLYQIMRKCWHPNPKDRPTFAEIAHEIREMLNMLEHAMHQGRESVNIDNMYVNMDKCTDYHYTDELMPPESPLSDDDDAVPEMPAPPVPLDVEAEDVESSRNNSG